MLQRIAINTTRWDETWHRLREWTNGQGPSERLAAQILLKEGFAGLDPSHPLGGKDGGRDAVCTKSGKKWIMAVFFPRGQQPFLDIKRKFENDLSGARKNRAQGFAFVTNQELALGERESLTKIATPEVVEFYHLERLTSILDAPDMAAVRKQFLRIDNSEESGISLGGQGGLAPGAGGGGGGAIGTGSRGGEGGPGGNVTFAGSAGQAPGAGGGGEGAIGDGARAGDGGGDFVSITIGPHEFQQLREAGFDHAEFRVGRGGDAGAPGEDTIVNLMTADGKVLKSIVARGGKSGLRGPSEPTGREITTNDVEKGLHVSTLLLAECAHMRDGILYLLAGGRERFEVLSVPFQADWPLAITLSMGKVDPETLLRLSVVVTDPKGFQISEEIFTLSSGVVRSVARPTTVVPVRVSGSTAGVWLITIVSGGIALSRLPVEVVVRRQT